MSASKAAIVVCCAAALLVFISYFALNSSPSIDVSTSSSTALSTKALIREAAQWSTIAQQDSNPLLALMHATYGMAYLNVARRLHTDSDIEAASNVRVEEFSATLQSNQQAAVQKLLTLCPMSTPAGIASLQTGWLS